MRPQVFVAVIIVFLSLLASVAVPPPNDNFTNRIVLTAIPTNVFGTTVDGTVELAEPPGYHHASTVWYEWTPTVAGIIRMRVFFEKLDYPEKDMIVNRFTGNTLTNLTLTDFWYCRSTSEINFPVVPGVTSQFRFNIAQDMSMPRWDRPFNFTLEYNTPPPNDHFTNRLRLTNDVELITYRNVVATTEPAEPLIHAGGHSVWYEWTPTAPVLTTHLTLINPVGEPNLGTSTGVSVYWAANDRFDQLVLVTNTCAGDVLFYATNGQKYFLQFDVCMTNIYPLGGTLAEPRWLLSHGFAARTLNITYNPTTGATLKILRDPTVHYAIGAKTNLTDPWSHVTNIWSFWWDDNPIITFNHPDATNSPRRFYGVGPVIEP
jgi:hypothetical protein